MFEQQNDISESGLGEIFNSLKCRIVRQPPESRSNSKLEKQKKVIFDKFREDQLSSLRKQEAVTQSHDTSIPDSRNRNVVIQESNEMAVPEIGLKPHTYREKNALSKHKRNFFSTSATPGIDDKDFFDRNFACINQQQVSRVKHKFLQDA